ncbi:MAG: bifunctional 4-hydroxy-2-oxoglutarate aldolase/2-dehydro-3-deoxy-phosphogluconate aldolase [Gammaproteobacteria bacterium]
MTIHQIMSISTVIPVVNIDDADDAVPLAKALLAGGVGIIEITLRTPAAIESIARVVREVPEMCVGAGTVWTKQDAKQVRKTGAHFIVSPGRTDSVYKYCKKHNIPLLPGTQTASEIALWVERGFEAVKFFPAEVAGGLTALKAFGSVFGNLKFCPTGGITSESAPDYLAHPSIPCVGGSWLVEKQAVKAGDWKRIEEAARAVSGSAPSADSKSASTDTSSPPWN